MYNDVGMVLFMCFMSSLCNTRWVDYCFVCPNCCSLS